MVSLAGVCNRRYVHGLSFSVIDVMLFANTKAAFESLHGRLMTHFNFLQANLYTSTYTNAHEHARACALVACACKRVPVGLVSLQL